MSLFNTVEYYEGHRKFVHRYSYNGKERKKTYLVHRDGMITNEITGKPLKRHIRLTKNDNTGATYFQVQVRFPEKFYNWGRVVAAAWFKDFDIDDPEQIIKQRNNNHLDFRPTNLYVTTKQKFANETRVLTEAEQKHIRFLRKNEGMRIYKIAKLYNVNKSTVVKVLKEEY